MINLFFFFKRWKMPAVSSCWCLHIVLFFLHLDKIINQIRQRKATNHQIWEASTIRCLEFVLEKNDEWLINDKNSWWIKLTYHCSSGLIDNQSSCSPTCWNDLRNLTINVVVLSIFNRLEPNPSCWLRTVCSQATTDKS